MSSEPIKRLRYFIGGTIMLAWAISAAFSHQVPTKVDFRRDVQPLLKQYCIGCHGPSLQMNSFRLDRRRDAMRGGTIAVIAPGNSAGSRLYLKLIGSQYGPQMPPTGPLRQEQIDLIRTWIDQGAEWPDDLSGETATSQPDPKAAGLLGALRDGERQAFNKLVTQEPALANLKGPGGTTPLMQAALYGDSDSVRLLLENGANPNIRNEAGATALMWAVNDPDKTRLLLKHGADANARSDDGRTPLLIAAGQFGSYAVVKMLLDHGADLSAKSPSVFGDVTPVTQAARVGDEALLRMLIERGADVKSAGFLPLSLAVRSNCWKCLDMLMERVNRDTLSNAAVFAAPPFGDARAVKTLLDRGADVNARGPGGHTILMLAANSDALPVDAVQGLIDRGADLNAKNPEGKTAIDFARQRGSTTVVGLLAKAGARQGAESPNPVLRPAPAISIQAALQRSIPLLQKTDSIFIQKSGCVSCHNNSLTAMTIATARKNGVTIDDQIAHKQLKAIGSYIESWRERALQGIGIPGDSDSISYILLGLAAENASPDPATDALARYVKSQQCPDGRWRTIAHRPPLESNDIQVTAASLRALQVYGPKSQRVEYDTAVKRATDWLMNAQPRTTEERAFKLFGLSWAGVNPNKEVLRKTARELLAEQRPDGGWAQLPSLASDAYATGQALVALKEGGMLPVNDPVYKRGIQFLLDTQLEDGSWYVKSRAIPIQPFFESGFPHGHDQWISVAASNWATMALALVMVPQQSKAH